MHTSAHAVARSSRRRFLSTATLLASLLAAAACPAQPAARPALQTLGAPSGAHALVRLGGAPWREHLRATAVPSRRVTSAAFARAVLSPGRLAPAHAAPPTRAASLPMKRRR